MDNIIPFLVIFSFLGFAFWWIIYTHTSHSKTNGNILKEDAIIIRTKTESVGGHKTTNAVLRTTVTFSDGFVFISHKSTMRMLGPLGMTGYISVDELLLHEIKLDAIAAHQKAYRKQNYV